jgi:uncharacterized protein (TIGR01244 family)
VTGLAVLALALAGDAPAAVAPASIDAARIPGYVRVRPDVAVAGQPSLEGLERLSELGFRTVVNLRAEGEADAAGERARIVAQGLRYVSVPVTAASLDRQAVSAVAKLLEDRGAGPVLIHCTSGNRAGGVWALIEAAQGVALEDALAEGRKAGLASDAMVAAVRRVAGESAPDLPR